MSLQASCNKDHNGAPCNCRVRRKKLLHILKSFSFAVFPPTTPIFAYEIIQTLKRRKYARQCEEVLSEERRLRNPKIYARPLFLPIKGLPYTLNIASAKNSHSQTQSLLISKIPREIRQMVLDAIFTDIDIHATVLTKSKYYELCVSPCLSSNTRNDCRQHNVYSGSDPHPWTRNSYDLYCWHSYRDSLREAPDRTLDLDILRSSCRALSVLRSCRLLQLEGFESMISTANLVLPRGGFLNTTGPRVTSVLPIRTHKCKLSPSPHMSYCRHRASQRLDFWSMFGPPADCAQRVILALVGRGLDRIVFVDGDKPSDAEMAFIEVLKKATVEQMTLFEQRGKNIVLELQFGRGKLTLDRETLIRHRLPLYEAELDREVIEMAIQ